MLDLLDQLDRFAPHGLCLLYDPWLIFSYVASNSLVALAYVLMPMAMLAVMREVRRASGVEFVPFRALVASFALFILFCGISHMTKILTIFVGGWAYLLDAGVDLATALVSLATCVSLMATRPLIADFVARVVRR